MDSVIEEVPADAHFGRLKSRTLRFLIAESTILIVLILNTVVFLSATLNPEAMARFGHWVTHIDMACVLYFVFEAALKLWALGRTRYFANRWNTFDFFIVLASLPVLLAAFVDLPEHMMAAVLTLRFARFLRVLRMVRYVHASRALVMLRGPIFSLVVLVAYKSFILDTPEMLPQGTEKWAVNAYQFLIVMLAFWLLSRLYGMFDTVVVRPKTLGVEAKLDGLLMSFVRTLVGLACLMTGFILGLKNMGQDPWTILAGIGIGGMAVAFAAQDTIANIISGVFLFLQRPFKIGERITIAGITGKVVSIGLRSVAVQPPTGELAIIPNKNFTGNPLFNIDARTAYFNRITLPIDAETTAAKLEEAIALLYDIGKSAGDLLVYHFVNFDRIPGDGSFIVDFVILVKKWSPDEKAKYPDDGTKMIMVPTAIKIEVVRRFAEAGIAFHRLDAMVLTGGVKPA
ncbi:MAG: mechanosensitive ion channel domain-containing protein [Comamonadaceae bacterium]